MSRVYIDTRDQGMHALFVSTKEKPVKCEKVAQNPKENIKDSKSECHEPKILEVLEVQQRPSRRYQKVLRPADSTGRPYSSMRCLVNTYAYVHQQNEQMSE